jgi:predicted AAA+ superfamily ATPase
LVGIFGHRQVGKSTFLEGHSRNYRTLDDAHTLRSARNDPQEFLRELRGHASAIDECQLAPELFPALKLWVQKNKKPGQFYLSGSVRFTSRKAIRESLTGRISTLEMFPLTLTELLRAEPARFVQKFSMAKDIKGFANEIRMPLSVHRQRMKAFETYLLNGGLPGVCFVRDTKIRERMIDDILKTMLDRDLRLVQASPFALSEIMGLCRELSRHALEPLHYADLRRESGMMPRTLKKLMNAFESIYLVRRLKVEGGGTKSEMIFFEDQAEQNFLSQHANSFKAQRAGLIYRQLQAQFAYTLQSDVSFFSYLTRARASVPLAARVGAAVVGFYPVSKESDYDRGAQASVASFLKQYESARVVVVNESSAAVEALSNRVLVAPPSLVLF